jgi:cytochrome c-type biogenesis protein CcmH/NrfG
LRQHPDSAQALVALAMASNQLEGSKYLALALKLDPDNAAAHYLYGLWWLYQHRDDLARDQYRRLEDLHSPLAERLLHEIN